jgi:hypothetical protein
VRVAKKPSMALSQEPDVGVKWNVHVFPGWFAERQRDDALGCLRTQRFDAGRPSLIAKQTLNPSSIKRSCQRQTHVLDLPV